MNYVSIKGTASSVPRTKISNNELSNYVDTTDEWIASRTGIKSRHLSTGETTTSLAVSAAKEALARSNTRGEDIDLIIVATISPEYFMPSTACLVQEEIGAINATSFDLSAACSGFVYGLKLASQGIRCGDYKTALLIGSEVLSKTLDWEDRSTCVLFGDGAGAVILSQDQKPGIIKTYTGSDGGGAGLLTLRASKNKNILYEGEEYNPYMEMKGRQVYSFANKIVPICIEKLLDGTEYTINDIDHFVLHQANERIIDSLARKMKLPIGRFHKNIADYGNTSAASIPIALNQLDEKGSLNKGDLVIIVGFGGGLTWGSALIKW
ncbi:MAG: ketoacyl-ACP synthase III [Epulopiscium sp.]|mgnify:CR=1 FL=1|nr:ketoacyl-ACP synthase III [Candidatus Epulonipiscium sp.]